MYTRNTLHELACERAPLPSHTSSSQIVNDMRRCTCRFLTKLIIRRSRKLHAS